MQQAIRLTPLPSIKELLWLYKIKALKNMSQNFLLKDKITNKIVKAAGIIREHEVCEIGPGPGGITRNIIRQNPNRIIVVEKDPRFKAILEGLSKCSLCKFDIIYDDIRNVDMSNMFSDSLRKDWWDASPNISLIGNLPFNVSSPLIFQWLKDISLRRNAWAYGRVKMTLTFQEEVARRIVAPILTKQRGRISVMCQTWCDVSYQFCIHGESFIPAPDVDVGVVTFEPRREPLIPFSYDLVEKVVSTIFNGRQKIIKKSVSNLFPEKYRKSLTEKIIEMAELRSSIRAFQVTNEEYGRIVEAYKKICDEDPRLYSYNFRGPRVKREYDWLDEPEEEEIAQDSNDRSV